MIDIVYFTYNRLTYTKQTLPAMIENAGEEFSLTIIDNGSTDGTVEYLKEMEVHYRKVIRKILFNSQNHGLALPTNVFWRTSKAEYLGKVDNDTLPPPGWLARLLEAQKQSDKLGVIGGFHFNMRYVDEAALERRVVSVDGVRFIPDAFIGGCCYLFKKSLQERFGYLQVPVGKKTHGWTEYQIMLRLQGYHNGYLYPLLHVEHFDDPLSEFNLVFTEHAETSSISLAEKGILPTREHLLAFYVNDARRVEKGSSLLRFGLPLSP